MPYSLTSHQDAAASAKSVSLQQEKKQEDIIDQKRHNEELEKARASQDIAAVEQLEREAQALIAHNKENDLQRQHQRSAKEAERQKEELEDKKEVAVAEKTHAVWDNANGAINQMRIAKGEAPFVDNDYERTMEKIRRRLKAREEEKRREEEEDRRQEAEEQARVG